MTWVKQLKSQKNKSEQLEIVSNHQDSILGKKFTLYLYWIAVVRYLIWIIRGTLIAMAGGFQIKLWAIAFISPIVQLAMLLSFTPANLGFMEFSWIGLLDLFNVSGEVAVQFALMQRFLSLIHI